MSVFSCAAVALSACSWLTIDEVPDNYRALKQIPCTTSRVAPGLDTLGMLGWVAGAVIATAVTEDPLYAIPGGGVGLLYGGSAVYGYNHTSKCVAAIDEINRQDSYDRSSSRPTANANPQNAERVTSEETTDGGTVLRLQLGIARLGVVLYGTPKTDPEGFRITAWRATERDPFRPGCSGLDVTGLAEAHMRLETKHSQVVRFGTRWDTLNAAASRETIEAILAADSPKLRVCEDVLVLYPSRLTLIKQFLDQWDSMATTAAPSEAPSEVAPSPTSPAGSQEQTAPAPAGCQYDTQCKGDRQCVEGRCVNPPDPASE